MKPHDYPVLDSYDGKPKDERCNGVVLLSFDDDSKQTAEDCGEWWYIREWEVTTLMAGYPPSWSARSGYSISKKSVAALARLGK